MPLAELGPFNYTLLWLYAVCFILLWVYLPLVERVKDVPPWLYWSWLVLHVAGFAAMVVYLTEVAIASPCLWWLLLSVFVGLVLLGDFMCYRWMMSKPEPRVSKNQQRVACFVAVAVHTVMRLPCAVVIYWLAAGV